MKLTKILGFTVLSLCMASTANAAFKVALSDGSTTTFIADGSAADFASPVTGAIQYSCFSCFGGWDVAFSVATSKPLVGSANLPYMHLTGGVTGTGTGPLYIYVTDTDFTGPTQGVFSSAAATNLVANGTMSMDTYISSTNTEFAGSLLTSQVATSGAHGYVDYANYTTSSPFSLTMVATIDHTNGKGSSSIDWTLKVPAPATLALLGIGLLGMGAASRRRSKKA